MLPAMGAILSMERMKQRARVGGDFFSTLGFILSIERIAPMAGNMAAVCF